LSRSGSRSKSRSRTEDDGALRKWQKGGDAKKWSLGFRFLDPTLLALSIPLPGIEHELIGATCLRISLPSAPAGSPPAGFSSLVRRTNLLSPSVTLLPVFKVAQITATNYYYLQIARGRQVIFINIFCTRHPRRNTKDAGTEFPAAFNAHCGIFQGPTTISHISNFNSMNYKDICCCKFSLASNE